MARELFLIADSSADVHGIHSAIWRKVQRSAFDLVSYRLPANDAQEFLLPSYFHFVRVLEVPCTEMFDCPVFRA